MGQLQPDGLMWRGVRIAAVVVVAVLWTVITSQERVPLWTNEPALWVDAAAHAPLKPRPWINLGKQYVIDGDEALATEAYETGIRLAQAPGRSREEQIVGRAVGEINLALLQLQTGHVYEAVSLAGQVATRMPQSPTIQRMATWIGAHQSE